MDKEITFREIWPGKAASAFARDVWHSLPKTLQRHSLFDVPQDKKAEQLQKIWAVSSHVAYCRPPDGTKAWGWLIPSTKNSRTAFCHFILPAMSWEQNAEVMRIFLRLSFRYYDTILCLVPGHYKTIRQCLEATVFKQSARLPKSCLMAHLNKNVDGILYIANREEYESNYNYSGTAQEQG